MALKTFNYTNDKYIDGVDTRNEINNIVGNSNAFNYVFIGKIATTDSVDFTLQANSVLYMAGLCVRVTSDETYSTTNGTYLVAMINYAEVPDPTLPDDPDATIENYSVELIQCTADNFPAEMGQKWDNGIYKALRFAYLSPSNADNGYIDTSIMKNGLSSKGGKNTKPYTLTIGNMNSNGNEVDIKTNAISWGGDMSILRQVASDGVGGIIRLRKGTYIATNASMSNIIMEKYGNLFIIEGEGADNTIIQRDSPADATAAIIYDNEAFEGSQENGYIFKGITFDGQHTEHPLFETGAYRLEFHDCNFINGQTFLKMLTNTTLNEHRLVIKNCKFFTETPYVFNLKSIDFAANTVVSALNNYSVILDNCEFNNAHYTLWALGANTTIRNCIFNECMYGISSGSDESSNITIEGNKFYHHGNTLGFVSLYSGHNLKIINNTIDCDLTSKSGYLVDIVPLSAVITGNTFNNAATQVTTYNQNMCAIGTRAGSNMIISNNTITNFGRAIRVAKQDDTFNGIHNINITNNVAFISQREGIEFYSKTFGGCIVTGNILQRSLDGTAATRNPTIRGNIFGIIAGNVTCETITDISQDTLLRKDNITLG